MWSGANRRHRAAGPAGCRAGEHVVGVSGLDVLAPAVGRWGAGDATIVSRPTTAARRAGTATAITHGSSDGPAGWACPGGGVGWTGGLVGAGAVGVERGWRLAEPWSLGGTAPPLGMVAWLGWLLAQPATSRAVAVSQPVRSSTAPRPGTQEIASSNYLSGLVFFHFIKLAFTIGIESSFQILEIRSQWLHLLSSSSKGVFPSDTMIVIFGQVPGATSAPVWQSDRNPVVGDRGERRPHRRALPLVRARAARRRLDTRSGGLAFAVLIG